MSSFNWSFYGVLGSQNEGQTSKGSHWNGNEMVLVINLVVEKKIKFYIFPLLFICEPLTHGKGMGSQSFLWRKEEMNGHRFNYSPQNI